MENSKIYLTSKIEEKNYKTDDSMTYSTSTMRVGFFYETTDGVKRSVLTFANFVEMMEMKGLKYRYYKTNSVIYDNYENGRYFYRIRFFDGDDCRVTYLFDSDDILQNYYEVCKTTLSSNKYLSSSIDNTKK